VVPAGPSGCGRGAGEVTWERQQMSDRKSASIEECLLARGTGQRYRKLMAPE